MTVRRNSAQVIYPIVIFDDDYWIYVAKSLADLESLVEPTFAEEIVHAFDALARSLDIRIEGDEVRVRIETAEPDFVALRNEVARFFSYWTNDPPPTLENTDSFLCDLSESLVTTTFRRKRRKK